MDRKTEDRVVASSDGETAPEHRMEIVQRCEFTREFATSQIHLSLPMGQQAELSETRQLELLIQLLERALPEVGRRERELELDWRRWRRAVADQEPQGAASAASVGRKPETP